MTSKYEERLSPIQVGLRKDVIFTRQVVGGEPTYVAHDPITFQNNVFNAFEFRVMSGVVACRSLGENFARMVKKGVLEEEDADSFYSFILELHGKNLLQLPVAHADELFKRHARKQAARRAHWYRSLLYFKLPLFSPDLFLERTLRHVSWMFSKVGFALWTVLMLCVAWKCFGRFGEIYSQAGGLLSTSNLPIMWLALVFLKVIHEFGHAYACKRWGGTVPEMGVAFIVMTPCAFVDAGSSWTFPNRWHRIAVAMAGMYVELIVAGVFALIWASTPPGLLHDVSLNVIVLASVVTIFFNLNPLIKFDGYFVASDLLGIINLRQRADDFLRERIRWLALGLGKPSDDLPRREKWILGAYAPCAFLYKCFLAFTITFMVIAQWTSGGVFLGLLFAWMLIVQPLVQVASYLLHSEATASVRTRARRVAFGAYVLVPIVIAIMPMSASIEVPGVIEPLVTDSIRAPLSGFVDGVGAEHGAQVPAGTVLCVLRNPHANLKHIEAVGEVAEETVRLDAEELRDATLASTSRVRLAHLKARVAEMDRRIRAMNVKTKIGGVVVSNKPEGWVGRHVKLGDELFQVHSAKKLLRVVLTDHDVERARLQTGSVAKVRLVSDPSRTIRGVVREIRRVSSRDDIPPELTMLAGGDIYARPSGSRAESVRPYLHVFLDLEAPVGGGGAGLTARVRMPARMETIGGYLKRTILEFYNSWKMS